MSEQKNYQYFAGEKVGDVVYGHHEGWTFAKKSDIGDDGKPSKSLVTLDKINRNGKDVSYANVTVSCNANPNTIKYLFGEEFVPKEGQNLFIRVTLWGAIAENFNKYNPSLQQVIGFTGKYTINEHNGNKNIQMSATNFKIVTKKKAELAFDGNTVASSSGEDIEPVYESSAEIPF